ncbi:MAG: hypothetical protein LBD31_11040 [Treponema sp.]|nr:hypothetical protein [Treponema sp.]
MLNRRSPAVLVFFLSFRLAAQDVSGENRGPPREERPGQEPPPGIITDIEITGLKRTKLRAARYPLEQFLGRSAASLDPREVEAAVKDSGVLEPVSVETAEGPAGCILRVRVEEKWTIFPIPLVMVSSRDASFGLFLADTNAFGLRDQAVLGGMYSGTSWMAMAMYNNTPDRRGRPGWNAAFMFNRREREDTNRNEETLRRYPVDTLLLSLDVTYPLTRHISAAGGVSFTQAALPEDASALNPPGAGAVVIGFSPGLSFRASGWDGFLLSQQSLSVKYGYYLGAEGPSHHRVLVRGIYEKSLIPGLRLALRGGAFWTPGGAGSLFESGPEEVQVNILPRTFSASNYGGLSAGFEKHLFKTRQGTLSILASWQAVLSSGPLAGTEFDHGPAGEIRFYLSRLAIPALGLVLGYNMQSGLPQFVFSMGAGF